MRQHANLIFRAPSGRRVDLLVPIDFHPVDDAYGVIIDGCAVGCVHEVDRGWRTPRGVRRRTRLGAVCDLVGAESYLRLYRYAWERGRWELAGRLRFGQQLWDLADIRRILATRP